MVDMFKVKDFIKFYQDQYPELRIYAVYDPYEEIVKWEFDTHSFFINRYESYTGSCIAYDRECNLDNTSYVIHNINRSLMDFLSTSGVKAILQQHRLVKL